MHYVRYERYLSYLVYVMYVRQAFQNHKCGRPFVNRECLHVHTLLYSTSASTSNHSSAMQPSWKRIVLFERYKEVD